MSARTVLLVDDHTLVRAGLRKLLESMPSVRVVGEAGDGLSALALALQLQPDLVLMDIGMPGLSGLEASARLRQVQPATRVLILSMHQNREYVRQALRNGAAGYLVKDAAPLELDIALETVLRGEIYLSAALATDADPAGGRAAADGGALGALSPRQREVLTLIAEGHGTKAIARQLGLSVKTVETHRSGLMKQLDIHEVASLVRFAVRNGLVSVET
jgi:DNA-binding NarL/FixJ family response regulator